MLLTDNLDDGVETTYGLGDTNLRVMPIGTMHWDA